MTVFTTAAGAVRGERTVRDPGIVRVLGIPYAAPPFGAARFREPLPPRPWSGVRRGDRFGPVAPQSAELPGAPSWSPGDEDVLTLNVWTPGATGDRLPVLVWIHGGAYAFGSSAQPDFEGTALAALGLVVVTFNYRVGFDGFGHVPGAPGEPDRPDGHNRGLLDQIAALEWVRDTIGVFGGDASRVTVAGQSAGASSVACLMAMDRARGLFRRAVLHSPANSCATAASAARTTREIAGAAGLPATREALAAAGPGRLVAATDAVVAAARKDPAAGQRHHDPAVHGPVVDGVTLRADPLTAARSGAGAGVDVLVCRTTEEYALMEAVGSSARIPDDARLTAFARDFDVPGPVIEGYRALLPDAPAQRVYEVAYGDLLFAEYADRLAEAYAAAGGTVHLARFDRRTGGEPPRPVRAWHCADIPFAFGNLDDERLHFLVGGAPGPADHELSARMAGAWADFAATGDPGWAPLPAGAPAGCATEAAVHVWRAGDAEGEPATGASPGARRALWRGAELPLLQP
ncbi:carboxylesterase/lipase family protein [uncultured Streptomyces sp.]|uniref:carboxylesterase/lipase family protein n=1 Tax=uncultured Streptomyces sp. TaxID=174707 RepID=UPI00261C0146|nr:carboxylesterase family protein [uncultured Streptomyces sp.]